ncbi:glycosyltransferase family 4 protein [Zunongwangia sp. F260]|uniref:Glycosyltransferase family 4 protein n=1 Tax=Autumnicola lenta TaxID=3075593 RepID=A0ABU3CG45_9FLAO|nr:glycosyltransferase family 4 protein [Zunongwangia sp. F260]MDT0645324.1 glycosyltransferase family 4 protein [Zunongwangia sp. F260]
MHLAFLTPEYPHTLSTSTGGLGTSIKNMVIALVEKGVTVTVFIYGQQQDKIFTEEGIHFHFIKQQHYKFLGWYFYRKFLQNYLNRAIVEENIDAIEAPDWTGITAFIKLKCPLVIRMNGSDAYFCNLENRPQKKKNYWFEKLALKGADHLLSVSQFTAEKTASIFHLERKIKIIPNSVDINRFSPQQQGIKPGTVLYFGSLIRKKGVLELPEIFNHLERENLPVQLKLAGRDVTDKATGRSTKNLMLENFSPGAAQKIVWLGNLPYEEILEEILNAHVIVLPSFAEALPMTWIEAMSMEKALVTSDIGWAKEVMVDGETGYTVDPKNHQLYASRIFQLLTKPALAKSMGKAARERIMNKFSTKVVVEENIRFYKSITRSTS